MRMKKVNCESKLDVGLRMCDINDCQRNCWQVMHCSASKYV